MTVEEAIRHIRKDPRYADLLHDAYLDEDVGQAARRFSSSPEFEEVREIAQFQLEGGRVLDLGAGNGIASFAFASAGARIVYALDPDASHEVGIGALLTTADGSAVAPVIGVGEAIPLRDQSIDLVYVRQVLHHASDLHRLLSECARVLTPGGMLLACREHVVDDEEQLKEFLEKHPVHRFTGSENAFSLQEYLQAIESSGLRIQLVLRPWDSVINSFPTVTTATDLKRGPAVVLQSRFGFLGRAVSYLPGVNGLVRSRVDRKPGRMYSFAATKP